MQEFIHPNGRACLVKENDREIWLCDKTFSLYLDHVNREGEAYLTKEMQWENVLRVSYFFELLEQHGLLLHASGLVKNGMAYLFPGVTGSGKTTLVRQSPDLQLLSDEMPAVALEKANGSQVVALGTPFFGDWGVPGEKTSAPLKGLYFPSKAGEDRLIPISPGEALARLLPCVCTFTNLEPRLREVFNLVKELLHRVPAYVLEFRPTPDFWQVIDGS